MSKKFEKPKVITRKQELREKPEERISIKDVALVFDLSENQMRNYKNLGIIRPVGKEGMKDLYDLEIINKIAELCTEYRFEGFTLNQIADKLKVLNEKNDKEAKPKLAKSEEKKDTITKIVRDLQNGIGELAKVVSLL